MICKIGKRAFHFTNGGLEYLYNELWKETKKVVADKSTYHPTVWS